MKKYFLLGLFFITTQMISSQNVKILYTVSMPEPEKHIFHVEIEYSGINDDYIDLILPVWRPGRYLIFDFSSGVVNFRAFSSDSNSLKWKKVDKCTWKIETKFQSSIIVKYDVFADEFNLRTRGLNALHGFIDGTSVFMYSEKYRNDPVMIKVVPYIQTIGSEVFKKFISLPFSVNLLYSITSEEGINVIFDGWYGKNMGTYYKFYNEEKVVLEFYAGYYTIIKNTKKYVLPLPKTINDFINDMDRFEIELFWNQWMNDNFEPKDYLHVDEIPTYFTNLLVKMKKEQDLN